MLNIYETFLTFFWLLLLVAGQICFKYTAMGLEVNSFKQLLQSLVVSVFFWLAIVLYAVATILWIIILESMPLSKALPFSALSFVVVPLISRFLFNEFFYWYYWIGILLILSGIWVTNYAVK